MKLERLTPGMSLADAARSPILQTLSAIEALVYIRLVGLAEHDRKIYPKNVDLYRDGAASTIKALRALEEKRLIKIRRGPAIRAISNVGREIEVI